MQTTLQGALYLDTIHGSTEPSMRHMTKSSETFAVKQQTFASCSMLEDHPITAAHTDHRFGVSTRNTFKCCVIHAVLLSHMYAAWGRGDPHITTLDGRQYSFNGWGEYIMILLNESDFMVQCRTQLVINSTATQFSGFAFGLQNNSIVQVRAICTVPMI